MPLFLAVLFAGCAGDRMVCVREPFPVELSPAHRSELGFTLVSISRSGRVTVRLNDGTLADAAPGQLFEARDHKDCGTVRLRSVDVSSGRVILEMDVFALQPVSVERRSKPRLLYGLSDAEFNLLAEHLGYRVEALGMGDYVFWRDGRSFHVHAHYHQPVTRKDPSAEPVVLSAYPKHRRAIELRIPVAQGITFDAAEDSFRGFLQQAHLPCKPAS